jgi:hypothetical protein
MYHDEGCRFIFQINSATGIYSSGRKFRAVGYIGGQGQMTATEIAGPDRELAPVK